MNAEELACLSEGILTVENILPQQTKSQNEMMFYIITWINIYIKNSQSVSHSAIVGINGIVDIYVQIIRYAK